LGIVGRIVHIPLNPAADSERIRPPLGAPRRRASVICSQWPTSVRFCQSFAHRFSFQRDLIGVVHEPVKNGVGQCRFADGRVPVIDREARASGSELQGQAMLSQQSRQPLYRHPPNEENQKGVQSAIHPGDDMIDHRRIRGSRKAHPVPTFTTEVVIVKI